MSYKINVSNGEILDKFSILIIKQKYIKDPQKLININNEINCLNLISHNLLKNEPLLCLYNKLKTVNEKLWHIEDQIRAKEKNKEFDMDFINLARDVYKTNDERADIKKQINQVSFSSIIEEKSYEEY